MHRERPDYSRGGVESREVYLSRVTFVKGLLREGSCGDPCLIAIRREQKALGRVISLYQVRDSLSMEVGTSKSTRIGRLRREEFRLMNAIERSRRLSVFRSTYRS